MILISRTRLGFICSKLMPSKNDNEVVDITKIKDELNLKLKKRKREPVVSHPSDTVVGINSQAVHDHIANTQPSSSASPATPQLDQSISAA
ncbi:hypothetical protein HAX54_034355 [Datura stramonium]|uniref:Uncharacterized protein n=1 Tax=Datura stramonium TaxID=4076 RepID=A0ABS8VE03_DATST|nr:hypothetical protein [Datura stramonium]